MCFYIVYILIKKIIAVFYHIDRTWFINHLFFFSLLDSLGGPFPSTAHRCHHKPKRCLPLHPCGGVPVSPLLFHPNAKGSQIVMDLAQRSVKRQASFCNAITFSNRPIALYEQVRLKVRTRIGIDESGGMVGPEYSSGRHTQAHVNTSECLLQQRRR